MVQLKNISKYRPKGMIIDIAEEDAKEIIDTGEFIESTKEKLIVKKKKEEEIVEEDDKEEDIKDKKDK